MYTSMIAGYVLKAQRQNQHDTDYAEAHEIAHGRARRTVSALGAGVAGLIVFVVALSVLG